MNVVSMSSNDTALSPRMQGRVDAIDGGHVFGWAWHADHPAERLTIEALYEDKVIAKVLADRPRIDLRRNGIGDGSFAFDFQIEQNHGDPPKELTVRAIAASGEVLILRVPSPDERAAEAAVAIPLARVLERIELLIAAQRQTQLGQRETSTAMREMACRIDALAGEGGEIGSAVSLVAAAQTDLGERVSASEVFLSRFDSTLGGFDRRLGELQKVGSGDIKPLLVIAATLVGFVAGALLVLFMP